MGDRHLPTDANGVNVGTWDNGRYPLASDVLREWYGADCTLKLLSQREVPDEDEPSGNTLVRVVEIRAPAGHVAELALTRFTSVAWEEQRAALGAAHQEVLSGDPMGETFRRHRIPFVRRTHAIGQRLLPSGFCVYFGTARATVLTLGVYVGEEELHYAEVTEVFAGEIQWPEPPTPPTPETDRAIQAAIEEFDGHLLSLPA